MAVKAAVRIASGRFKGRRIVVPAGTRPTAARVREALLDIWSTRLPGARFLDLFAGCGAVGLEALSRGAASVVLVEEDAKTFEALNRTCGELARDETETLRLSLPRQLPKLQECFAQGFDLVFADPPYGFDVYPELLAGLAPLLVSGAELAAEHASGTQLPERSGALVRWDQRRYGDSALSFFRRAQD